MSTLHTNTAVGALTRLRDMGVEPFCFPRAGRRSRSRLVRVLNPDSKEAYVAGEYERRLLNLPASAPSPTLYRPARQQSGLQSRTGIYELVMSMTRCVR
jgi:general secretion pathway protein E